MNISPLPDLILEPLVKNALLEDFGRSGDVTSDALIPADHQWQAVMTARRPGVLAGLDLARLAFALVDPRVRFEPLVADGQSVEAGAKLARVAGPTRALLTAERTALNFVSHLSGIASATRLMVEAVKPHKAKICCTRKTTPGLRSVEKYAVRAGGGSNHRYGLDDGILIKDNHIAALGSLRDAVLKAREAAGHMMKIEVEVDTLDQLTQVLELPVDAVLLDNMGPDKLAEAVRMVGGRMLTEASGGVSMETVAALAASGVDLISCGALTHSAAILDIGLDEE